MTPPSMFDGDYDKPQLAVVKPPNGEALDPFNASEDRHLSDLGNALRLVDCYHDRMRYVRRWGPVAWDGTRWQRDGMDEVKHLARLTVQAIYGEAARASEADRRKELARWAMKSESSHAVAGMVELSRGDPRIWATPDDFDDRELTGYLLNVENGTVDLRTGECHPHDPQLYITKLAPVAYDPNATCPRWERFVSEIMDGDRDMVAFVQRALGYSATASCEERVVFVCHGPGKNGKSVLLQTAGELFGEYGHQAESDLLLERRNASGPRSGIAQLYGVRFVSVIETGQGRRLNVPLVKWLVGRDRLRGSFLYHDSFEFHPTHTPWLATNHKPQIREVGRAIWDRILLVPFDVSFEKSEDRKLPEKLHRELPGILNWVVAGARAWAKDGLNPPEKVRVATEKYREAEDILGPFLADRCELGDGHFEKSADLWNAYKLWSKDNGLCNDKGEPQVTRREFTEQLETRGCEQTRDMHARKWNGIRLLGGIQ